MSLPGIFVHYPFSVTATGAVVANGLERPEALGPTSLGQHWASAPESGNPWQQGTCRGARRADRKAPPKGVSQTP